MVSFCICYGKKRILFRIPVCDHGVSLSCEGRPDPKKCVWMAHGIFPRADDVGGMDHHAEDRRVVA